jgi:DNA polymerase-3 subunit beta
MSGIIKKDHVIPITSAVLFSFSKDILTITGTDLETTYVIVLEVECKESFAFPIDYADISEIASSTFSPITIELGEKEISIKSAKSKFKLVRVGEAEHFPSVPDDVYDFSMEVEGDFFYHLGYANTCRFKGELQPALNMAAILISKNEMDVVGCDSFMMYKKTFKQKSNKELTVMVCDSFVNTCKVFQETTISIGEKFIKAVHGNSTVISRLSENKYANIKSILPPSIDYNMELPKDELKSSLSVISVAAHLTSKQFVINFKDGKIKLVSQDIDFDKEAETEIDTEHTVLIDSICLNSSQMMHLCSLADTSKIDLAITTAQGNVYMKPKGDDSILMLIRPLTLNN